MKYLLDTNLCIDALRKRGSGALRRAFQVVDPNEIVLCSIVVAELLSGCYHSKERVRNLADVRDLRRLFRSLPFDDGAAEHWAEADAFLAAQGTTIGANDLLIASIALANGLTVVTHNTAHFTQIANLPFEDWQVLYANFGPTAPPTAGQP